MTIGIIKERKNPPDRRVVFSPSELVKLQNKYPTLKIKIESSGVRVFSDLEYFESGFEITSDLSDCDVLIGVKEVPVEYLIPNKKYFFFSHTIKKQAYNRKLLKACIEKNIDLFDHETIVNEKNTRLIGFGRYAGIVGVYNGFRAFGLKFELFNLPKAENLANQEALIMQLKKIILPPIKIVLTGKGKVAFGAKEILDGMKVREVSAHDYLSKTYTYPVYTLIDVKEYNKHIDGLVFDTNDFYSKPENYVSNFERFAEVSDIFVAGHFYGNGAPVILSREMLLSSKCKIKVVADISCDINGPIACTLRASTIAEPNYGYLASENKEVDMFHPAAIVVMAVDNLPCELPKDSSEGFGKMFSEHVMPSFFNADENGVLERAKITENGKLTTRFSYLQNYLDGIE